MRLALLAIMCPVLVHSVIVDTRYGPVEGQTFTLHTGNGVNSFLGIPFAKPPVGELRWRAPEEPDSWADPFPAISLGVSCIQRRPNELFFTHPLWNNYGEDCLNMNIFTPSTAEAGPYPVMVWIHGGGHDTGSNIQYPGHFIADKDVILVVPNYRVNIIGFGTTKDETVPGNYGMLDQVFALQWVQENIANFGGDPDQVTIFGESAGAKSTGLLLMSPLAKGLFHGAILQSGTEMNRGYELEVEDDQNYMLQVADEFDCPVEDTEDMMDCLRNVNARQLLRPNHTCTDGYMCGWNPRVDGNFLPDIPRNLRESGNYNKVPEMIGVNSEDGFLFQHPSTWLGASREVFEAVFRNILSRVLPRLPDADREEDLVQAALFMYTPWPHIHDEEINRDAVGRYQTDRQFGYHADLRAKLHSADDNDVFFYVYSHISNGSFIPDWMGCIHAAEINIIFGFPMLPFNEEVLNSTGITLTRDYDDTDVAFSDFMTSLWTNFAKFRTPTPTPVEPPAGDAGAVTWPVFTPDDLTYLWIGTDVVESRSNYRQEYYAFMQHYIPWLAYEQDMPFEDDDNLPMIEILENLIPDNDWFD